MENDMKKIILIFGLLLLFIPRNVDAADVCYDDQYFPSVSTLTKTIDGFEVDLSGAYIENPEGPTANMVIPVIKFQKNRWEHIGRRKDLNHQKSHYSRPDDCPIKIPVWPTISPKEWCKGAGDDEDYKFCLKNANNDEGPSSCTITTESVWFGINFYQGEGAYGEGGLCHYNRKSNIVEVRRIPKLRNNPIHKVVWDGKNIWAATTYNLECGNPPALGLVKYDWDNRKLTIFKDTETGPCGFIVNDLLWSDGSLWVATDIGLSRWNAKENKWTHYLPDLKPPYTVRKCRCDTLYKSILNSLPKEKQYLSGPESPYHFFYKYLKEYRPGFIKRYEAQ
jgi:hypothetical protein